jgi:hypothetical protein
MQFQFESIREQRLEHRLHFFLRRWSLRLAFDLVMIAMYPWRATGQFVVVIEEVIRPKNGAGESGDDSESLGIDNGRHVLILRRAFDGRDFEGAWLLLCGKQTDRNR